MIQGAIFDADGTLFNSMHIWENVGEEYLKSKGITPEKNYREKIKRMSLYQAAEYSTKKYNLSDSIDKIIEDIVKIVENFYKYDVMPKDGVPEFLELLKSREVKMCIATSAEKGLIAAALDRNKIKDYFEFIITCSEVGNGKNVPDIYIRSLEKLGTDKSCTIVFEDAAHAAATAKKAGFPVCGVFDESETDLSIKNMDYFINSFKEAGDLF